MPPAPRPRLGFVDSARVFAMLLMVQAHVCDNLLSDLSKSTAFFKAYWLTRGLTGPLFFALSGFAFVVASDGSWHEYRRLGPKLYARLRRAGLLIATGYLLQMPRWSGHVPWDFSPSEWNYLLRTGVLQCIGVCLLAALALLAVTRSKRSFAVGAVAIAAGAAVVAQALAQRDLPLALALLFGTKAGSLFPLVPWIGHFMLGAALARLYLDQPIRVGSPRRFALLVGSAGATLVSAGVIWRVIEGRSVLSLNLFASHASVFLTRAGAAWCMLAGLALAIGSARSPGWLKAVSSRAFSIYVLHLVILYGLPTIDGLEQRMGPSLDLVETFTLGPILLLTCAVLLGALSSTWQQAVLFARKVFKRWLAVRRSPADLDT